MTVKKRAHGNTATEAANTGDHAGQSVSTWMATAALPTFPVLTKAEHADVCIVGAGIVGLTTAYLLGRAGKSVVLIDDGPIAAGETERTTAHLCTALDDRYFELERLHGVTGAQLAAASHAAAIDEMERIVAEEKIDCDFERLDGYLFTPLGECPGLLEKELAAAHRVGLADVNLVARSPLVSFDTGPALCFPRQAQFDPLKYIAGLARAIIRDGGRIYTHTHATRIAGGSPVRIHTQDGPVLTADAAVVATNTPVNDLLAIHTKQSAYRTFVIGAMVPSGSVGKALYWDTAAPYHYIRVQALAAGPSSPATGDLLIVGGEDHKTGQADDTEKRYARLEEWTRTRFPMVTEIAYRWSGQVIEPMDGLAFIGPNPLDDPHVYIATGHSGNGMTYGTIVGTLLTDLIHGRENAWASLYMPSRKTLGAVVRFATESLNVAAQYAHWLAVGAIEENAAVPPGTGAIVRRGLRLVAAHCDDAGHVHECSAVCPHLEGIVTWNHSEHTWDCPCHGSRFDARGKVVNGPANTNLP